jgi:hypothetical protein
MPVAQAQTKSDVAGFLPLQVQLDALNRPAGDGVVYTAEWLEQIAAAGAYAYALSGEDGEPAFAVGFPYDRDYQARRRHVDALCAHLHRSGHRDLVAAVVS